MDDRAVRLECLAIAARVVREESQVLPLAQQFSDYVLAMAQRHSSQHSSTEYTSGDIPLD